LRRRPARKVAKTTASELQEVRDVGRFTDSVFIVVHGCFVDGVDILLRDFYYVMCKFSIGMPRALSDSESKRGSVCKIAPVFLFLNASTCFCGHSRSAATIGSQSGARGPNLGSLGDLLLVTRSTKSCCSSALLALTWSITTSYPSGSGPKKLRHP
jgi:hypothetical protein